MAKSSRKKRTKSSQQKKTTTNLDNGLESGLESNIDSGNTANIAHNANEDSSKQVQTSSVKSTAKSSGSKKARKGRRPQKKTNYTPWIIGGLILVGLIAFPQIQRQFKLRTATGEFAQLIREGSSDVRKLQVKHRDLGRGHVPFGTEITYNSLPPTSGRHYSSWINPGYYVDEQEPKQLVHSLEHGHVIVYYGEDIDQASKDTLIDWTSDFRNEWAGLLVAPFEIEGEGVILNAWRTTLTLDKFDPAITAAFIDRYRGRGPENPVR